MSQQDWNPEDWVWEQIRAGTVANFHDRLRRLEPKNSSGWEDDRRLSTAFLRKILYDQTFLKDIPPEGVRIVGAWFPKGLTLPTGHLDRELWLDQSRFEKPIDLSYQTVDGSLSLQGSFVAATSEGAPVIKLDGAKIDGQLNLDGATVAGALTMNGLQVGQNLFMNGSKEQPATFTAVDLSNAKIDGQISLDGATVTGALTMNELQVGKHLYMQGSKEQPTTFAAVDLSNAKIDGQLSLDGATVAGALTMNGLQVGKHLFMRGSKEQPTAFEAVDLSNAKIDGQLNLDGATVAGALTMNSLQVGQDLFMEGRKEQPAVFAAVDLTAAKIEGQLSLEGATVAGALTMNSLQVGRALFMHGSKEQPTAFAAVDLSNAKVDGQLNLDGATVAGALTMNSLQVGQNLFINGSREQPATFTTVDLSNAKIDGQLNLDGATVAGALTMNSLQVGRDLLMRGSQEVPATFAEVDLSNAKIEGQCSLRGAIIEGTLKMVALTVAEDLIMRVDDRFEWPSQFRHNVDLTRARIGGGITLSHAILEGELTADNTRVGTDLSMNNVRCSSTDQGVRASLRLLQVGATLNLEGAACARLDLSGSSIAGELRLPSMSWSGDSLLILRNTHASVLHDSDSAWPKQVELEGFTYDRLGGVGENGDTRRERQDQRNARYIGWLQKDPTYSPQPYEQLADVLRKTGEPAMAADVLYAARERARRELRFGWRFIGMTVLKWTIGYGLGLRYFRCLGWIVCLTALGMVVLHNDDASAQLGFGNSLVYSLQKLIPLVEFEKFDHVQLGYFARWCFYIDQLAGYVLALFLGAGLSGLTQKS